MGRLMSQSKEADKSNASFKYVELSEGTYRTCRGGELLVYGVVRQACCGAGSLHVCFEKIGAGSGG
jgi:hypothetical protein